MQADGDAPEVPRDIVRRVEKICAALPETSCRVDRWAYSFEIRRKPFCHLIAPDDGRGSPVPMIVVRPDPDEREVLVAIGHPYFASRSGPDRIGVILDANTDWTEMKELITESYRILAPKKLSALL